MHTSNAIILVTVLTLPCIALPGEGHGRYYPQNSALSVSELRFVLKTTLLVIEILEHESNALHNNPTAKNNLLKKQAEYNADATKVAAEIWRRTS